MTTKVSTLIIIALTITMLSCTERDNPFSMSVVETQVDELSKQELIQNVDNLLDIADYAFQKQKVFSAPLLSEETVYVRGKPDGSIETERHTTVKGAPLISVRLTHGNSDFSTSTITRTYDSEEDFTSGQISSERIATVIGLASGQIKTTTVRNDTMIATSFKTPVVTIRRDVTTSEPTAVTLNDPTEITDSSVMLSWSENQDTNFARYEIYHSQFSGVSSLDTLAGTVEEQATTTFTVSGLSAETIYC